VGYPVGYPISFQLVDIYLSINPRIIDTIRTSPIT